MLRHRRLIILMFLLIGVLLLTACDDTDARLESEFVDACTLSTLGMDEQECRETLDDIKANYPDEYNACIEDLDARGVLDGTELFVCLGQKNVGLD